MGAAIRKQNHGVPANVRGESAAATSDLQRIKANAPTGSVFLNFVAGNTTDVKKKLDYRVYIGSGASTDFNMHRNKDYVYKVDFNHVGIPTSDRRVTYIDPVPASENNDNVVPTANCFMVAPGGAFCFDPFAYQQNGAEITNDVLKGWCTTGTVGIRSVKLFWQTKENGDVGDAVMGIVNSNSDHSNVVDIRRTDGTDNFSISPATDRGQCYIYCRVAANTTGGSGLIVAYDGINGTGNILWSWHIWVTDYNPDATGDISVLEPANKRKLKFTYNNNSDQRPMMDRNLGAMAGYDVVPPSAVEKFKTHGFHYQWGRKEPFPSSYSSRNISNVILPSVISTPIDGIMSLYKADGITFMPFNSTFNAQATYQEAVRNPLNIYKKKDVLRWLSSQDLTGYDKAWGTTKGVHDPCPAGWRVVQLNECSSWFVDAAIIDKPVGNQAVNKKVGTSPATDGGMVLYGDKAGQETTYVRFTGYYYLDTQFYYIGSSALIWTGGYVASSTGASVKYVQFQNSGKGSITYGGHEREAIPLRCIQERK